MKKDASLLSAYKGLKRRASETKEEARQVVY